VRGTGEYFSGTGEYFSGVGDDAPLPAIQTSIFDREVDSNQKCISYQSLKAQQLNARGIPGQSISQEQLQENIAQCTASEQHERDTLRLVYGGGAAALVALWMLMRRKR